MTTKRDRARPGNGQTAKNKAARKTATSQAAAKRPPTIDLKAQGASRGSAAKAKTPAASTPAAGKKSAKKSATASTPSDSLSAKTEVKKTDEKDTATTTPPTDKTSGAAPAKKPPPTATGVQAQPARQTSSMRDMQGMLGLGLAAFGGGVVALLGSWALQPGDTDGTQALQQAYDARLSAMEKSMDMVQSTGTERATRVAAINGELGAVRDTLQIMQGAVAGAGARIDDLDGGLVGARAEIAALQRAMAEVPGADARQAAMRRLQGIEASLKGIAGDLEAAQAGTAALVARVTQLETRSSAAQASGRAAALTLALTSLERAVKSGSAYGSELDTVERIIGAEPALERLRVFAASGVPTRRMLMDEFDAAAVRIRAAIPAPPEADNWTGQVLSGARSYLGIQPTGAARGNDPQAVLARLRARLIAGDLAAAMAEYGRLDATAQAMAKAWFDRLNASEAAREALDGLLHSAVAALGRAQSATHATE